MRLGIPYRTMRDLITLLVRTFHVMDLGSVHLCGCIFAPLVGPLSWLAHFFCWPSIWGLGISCNLIFFCLQQKGGKLQNKLDFLGIGITGLPFFCRKMTLVAQIKWPPPPSREARQYVATSFVLSRPTQNYWGKYPPNGGSWKLMVARPVPFWDPGPLSGAVLVSARYISPNDFAKGRFYERILQGRPICESLQRSQRKAVVEHVVLFHSLRFFCSFLWNLCFF